jgi:hypothetical protein
VADPEYVSICQALQFLNRAQEVRLFIKRKQMAWHGQTRLQTEEEEARVDEALALMDCLMVIDCVCYRWPRSWTSWCVARRTRHSSPTRYHTHTQYITTHSIHQHINKPANPPHSWVPGLTLSPSVCVCVCPKVAFDLVESGNQHFLLDVNSTLFLDSAAPEAAAVPGAEEAKDGAPAPPPPPVNAPPVRPCILGLDGRRKAEMIDPFLYVLGVYSLY